MNITAPLAATFALLVVSGTLYAKPTKKFRRDGPNTATVVTLEVKGESVSGTFLYGKRVGDDPNAEPSGSAIPFTGKVVSCPAGERDRSRICMEVRFAGKIPPPDRKGHTIWYIKTGGDQQHLFISRSPGELRKWISSLGAF
jgi:hypothetical protein